MNLKQKQDLKDKIESLDELLKCVDSSLIYEHTTMNLNDLSNRLLGDMQAHFSFGDSMLSLNILLRIIKKLTIQIKGELGD